MKKGKIIAIALIATILMSLNSGSCDRSECGEYWFVNRTTHKVKIDSYSNYGLITEMSFAIQPTDSVCRVTCGIGGPPNPFNSSKISVDSINVVFDDTLSINTFYHLDYNPMNFKVRKEFVFVYEINNALYQKALEVNGYLK